MFKCGRTFKKKQKKRMLLQHHNGEEFLSFINEIKHQAGEREGSRVGKKHLKMKNTFKFNVLEAISRLKRQTIWKLRGQTSFQRSSRFFAPPNDGSNICHTKMHKSNVFSFVVVVLLLFDWLLSLFDFEFRPSYLFEYGQNHLQMLAFSQIDI